jgi:sugar/nucleoside kinase (ribokinase family)
VQLVVATLGQHGCMALGRGWPSPLHQAAPPVARLANVTGAGDAFAAGFLSELARREVARQALAPLPAHIVEAAMAAGQAAAAKKIAG